MRFPNKAYDYSQAVRTQHLFTDDFIHELVMGKRKRDYSSRKRSEVHAIFLAFLALVQKEIIVTSKRFILPTRPSASICIAPKTGLNMYYISKRRKGIYRNVNPIQTEGKIYQFYFNCMELPGKWKSRDIRIGYQSYQEIVTRANKGQFYPIGSFRSSLLMAALKKQYPLVYSKALWLILRTGFSRLTWHLIQDRDIQLMDPHHGFTMTFFNFSPKPTLCKTGLI